MTTSLRILAFTFSLFLFSCASAPAADNGCAECGMPVDPQSPFAARIIQGTTGHPFCDIGDLFSYVKRKKLHDLKAEVKDYRTGEWIDARKAYFVHDGKKFKTPMGWGIGAFSDKNEAAKAGAPLDYDGMEKALK